jgi:hypothetical protein
MTRSILILVLTIVMGGPSVAAPFLEQADNPPPAARPADLLRLVEALYVREFQIQIEPTNEQFTMLLPLIQRFLQNRLQNAQRKERALAALENAPTSDIARLNQEVDQATRQATNIDSNFVQNLDPILNLNQQRKLRQFHSNIWPRLQQMVNQAREQVQREQQLRQQRQLQRQQKQQEKAPR